jgi:hypothetical protein
VALPGGGIEKIMSKRTLSMALLGVVFSLAAAQADACTRTQTFGSPISQAYGNCAAIGGQVTGACTLMNPSTNYWVCPCQINCGYEQSDVLNLEQLSAAPVTPAFE